MLDNSELGIADLRLPPELADDLQDDTWEVVITNFARRLRQIGHVESAHFMEIAAMILKEKKRQ